METPHNKALFDGMYEVRTRLARAMERCKDVSLTERVMGYFESAAEYDELYKELLDSKTWIEKHMQSLLELA